MKLYEITNEIQQIDDADDIDKLNQLLAEFENKSNDLLRYCLNIEADINAIAEHVKALLDRKKSLEKKKEAIIEYIFNNMKMNDINEIKDKDALFVAKIAKNPPSVNILDDAIVPEEFKTMEVNVKIDKKGILQHCKNTGEIVAGVEIVSKERLQIKV